MKELKLKFFNLNYDFYWVFNYDLNRTNPL